MTVGCCSPQDEDWKSFMFHFHDFANLSTTTDHWITSPQFTCSGHQWELEVYPGGDSSADEGKVSFYLHHLLQGITTRIDTRYGIKVIDKFGKAWKDSYVIRHEFAADSEPWGYANFISRSDILDESKNILDDNGTLTVVVYMWEEEEPKSVFVPKNPLAKMMREKFNDQTTADLCFEVVSTEDEGKGEAHHTKSSVSFYAHRFVLENFAPMLAAICGSNESGGVVSTSVNDIKPEIFKYLLFYVYGGSVPEVALKADAKDIIDAADKYSIVNLKLAAEAAYIESTEISLDNAMDNLLYADSKHLALLKEAVMNFLAENHFDAAANISFTDCPGHVVKDLLIAVGRNSRKGGSGTNDDELTTLSVTALRKKLDKMGLDVDGSRETMIESIKNHSE